MYILRKVRKYRNMSQVTSYSHRPPTSSQCLIDLYVSLSFIHSFIVYYANNGSKHTQITQTKQHTNRQRNVRDKTLKYMQNMFRRLMSSDNLACQLCHNYASADYLYWSHVMDDLIICPIAIAYSMGQIIKSFCVCPCVCACVCVCVSVRLWTLSRSHFFVDFHQIGHRRVNPQK